MKNSKLLKVIATLNKNELKQFEQFLQSPYFVSSKNCDQYLPLFLLIKKAAPKFDVEKINKTQIYMLLYPDEGVINGKLEKLMSGLFKEVKNFIIAQSFKLKQKEDDSILPLVEFYRNRGLTDLYERAIKKIEILLATPQLENDEYFFKQILFAEKIEEFNERHRVSSKDKTLVSILKHLDRYFLYKKLSFGISLLARKVNISVEVEDSIELIEMVMPIIKQKPHLQTPSLQALYYGFQLLYNYQKKDDWYYFQLKEIVEEPSIQLHWKLKQSLQAILRVYAIGQSNFGRADFFKEAFDLFQKHLREGSLYHNNGIRPATMRTLVKLGLRLSEKEWVFQFLNDHKNRITGSPYPEEVYGINLANYYFQLNEYDKALDLLSFSFVDFYYKIDAKRLEIMIYFELKNLSILESRIEAFKVYIIRLSKEQLPEKNRRASMNFVNLMKQISNIQRSTNNEKILRLIEKTETYEIISERIWILEKLKKLEERDWRR